ncbi:tryptophan-rich sensory protein [Bacillus sp. FJAT-42376]|uniref:TspO/MBR family protein n=1 Tax=Bacillus sp. FJAT-42376 TaxID=2014076 RepID=UPI000F50342D|nr:tryptophan-rich sensory protein [Bacillus sp. FJAT-42376]AZB44108.1 tryptophan-rich sensory protein [Bacillus sp. FJAT-42376]
MLRSIFIFIITYALFSISGFLFQIDQTWYNALIKPEWTPGGGTIGLIWAVLFACIAASITIIDRKLKGLAKAAPLFWVILILNYVSNQLFSFFQFTQKNLGLASIDCAIVAITALILAVLAFRIQKFSGLLLIPYVLWTFFATYLSFTFYSMNG